MSGWLDTTSLRILEKGLDASSLRQKVLADNVANVDTPGFKRSEVDFEAILSSAMAGTKEILPLKATSPQHLTATENGLVNGIVQDQSSTLRNDGNNVDIDKEMANVAENGLYYEGVTRALSSQLGLLRMVIQGKP